jgi:hypothetical protein
MRTSECLFRKHLANRRARGLAVLEPIAFECVSLNELTPATFSSHNSNVFRHFLRRIACGVVSRGAGLSKSTPKPLPFIKAQVPRSAASESQGASNQSNGGIGENPGAPTKINRDDIGAARSQG